MAKTREEDDGLLPNHFEFEKTKTLGIGLQYATNNTDEVTKEFDALEAYVRNNITRETCDTARNNYKRNRYQDVLPFDSNIVKLQTSTGDEWRRFVK